jgi:hypothetical protein
LELGCGSFVRDGRLGWSEGGGCACTCAVAAALNAKAALKSVVTSFRGQRLVAGRGVSVAARRSIVVRAKDGGDAQEPAEGWPCRGCERVAVLRCAV